MHVKCRKCKNCLKARSVLWSNRAKIERSLSSRTWMGTLTLNPTSQHITLNQTRVRLAKGGTDYEALTVEEQFAEHVKTIGVEITKYFKRVRKSTGAPIRYLLVAEHHKSGLPHFHCLVHERSPDTPVRHASLASNWRLGFEHFKLVHSSKGVSYVTKYLTKSAAARVRASLYYGKPDEALRSAKRKEAPLEGAVEINQSSGERTKVTNEGHI